MGAFKRFSALNDADADGVCLAIASRLAMHTAPLLASSDTTNSHGLQVLTTHSASILGEAKARLGLQLGAHHVSQSVAQSRHGS